MMGAPSQLNYYRSAIENAILDFGIPSTRDTDNSIVINTSRLLEANIPGEQIDEWFFPGSRIMKAVDPSVPVPAVKKSKYSLFDIIREGEKRSYNVPMTLERIRRFFVSMYNQKVPGAVLNNGFKN
jgi:hypothetical protein